MKKNSVISAVIALIIMLGSFPCFAQDADSVLRQARNKLVFSVLSSENIGDVTEDLYLPAKWENTDVYWTSSNETLISIDGNKGVVSRPAYGDGRVCVILSAHISYENKSVVRNFMVRIEEMSIGREISKSLKSLRDDFDKEFMSNQNLMAVREDLIIPEFTRTYMAITCVSEDPEIITSDGKITRSMYEDKIVNFTVNFTFGYERTAVTYPIIVKSMATDEISEMAREDMDWVLDTLRSGYNLGRINESLILPTVGPNNSEISYSSSNSAVLSDKGTVTPDDESHKVELIVTVKIGSTTISEKLEITVPAKNSYSGSASGGGGAGGGSTSVSGGSGGVIMEMKDPVADIAPFDDVENSHWAKDAVKSLKDKGIINGDGSGKFRPDDFLTREELVKMIVLASGIEQNSETEALPFDDIKKTDWCYPYIYTAYSAGIIKGMSDSSFGKGKNITRQDTAVIIYNSLARNKHTFINGDEITFSDKDAVSNYAKTAVSALQQMGLINGKGDNKFMPKDNLTRAEAATMIWRMMKVK